MTEVIVKWIVLLGIGIPLVVVGWTCMIMFVRYMLFKKM